jgi:hypothetical protein
MRNLVALLLSLNLLVVCAPATGSEPAGAAPLAGSPVEPGRWREYELTFTYSGYTSKYSCDGLADKVQLLLKTFGVREGAKVSSFACAAPFGFPTEFPRVRLKFAVLEPWGPDAAQAADKPATYGRMMGREAPRLAAPGAVARGSVAGDVAPGEPVVGVWRHVKLARGRPRNLDPGDCELLEQFRDKVVPLFTTRALKDETRCIPYQLLGTRIALEAEVFAALPAGDTPR